MSLVYLDNIRDGNTLIIANKTKGEVETVRFARKGLKKTFTFTEDLVEMFNKKQNGSESSQSQTQLFNRRLGGVVEHLSKGQNCSVNIIKAGKSDGEPILISYDDYSCCWIIGTLRTSLGLQKADDLTMYNNDKINFISKRAADHFFNLLKDFSIEEVDALKLELQSATLVGEYVGDYELQRTIRHSRTDMFFHAIVSNNKDFDCFPPEEAFSTIEKYGFVAAAFEVHSKLATVQDISKNLREIIKTVKESTLQTEEEGAYVYIVLQKGNLQKVCSVAEVLSLEFRIYDQLNIRLLELIDTEKDANKLFNQFRDDVYSLVGDSDLHHSLNYYLNVGDEAFDFCFTFPKCGSFISNYYASFLSMIIYSLHQNIQLSPKIIQDKKKLKQIEGYNWYSYAIANLNLKNLDVKKRSKTGNSKPSKGVETELYKPKSTVTLQPPTSKTELEEPQPAGANQKFTHSLSNYAITDAQTKKYSIAVGSQSAIILPVTMPGIGLKTWIKETVKKIEALGLNVDSTVVETEELRGKVRDSMSSVQEKTGIEEYTRAFNEKYQEALEATVSEQLTNAKPGRLQVMFISGTTTPFTAVKFIQRIKGVLEGDLSGIKFLALGLSSARVEPNISIKLSDDRLTTFPFNHYCVMTCLKRQFQDSVASRKNKKPQEMAQTIENTLTNVSYFEGQQVNAADIKKLGFDGFIGFPFVNIQNESKFTSQRVYPRIVSLLDNIISAKQQRNESSADDIKELQQYVEELDLSPEWWEVSSSTGAGVEYDHFIACSVATLLGKFPGFGQKLLKTDAPEGSAEKQPAPQVSGLTKSKSVTKSSDPLLIPIDWENTDVENNLKIESGIKDQQKPIRNSNGVGKRKKPDYLSIRSTVEEVMLKPKLESLVLDAISKLEGIEAGVAQDLQEIKSRSNWKFISPFEVLVLQIGNKALTKTQDVIYNEFEEGVQFPFLLHGMVYIPRNTIIGITNINRDLVKIEDQYDHLDIMSTPSKPDSNFILQQVFASKDNSEALKANLSAMARVGMCDVQLDASPNAPAVRAYLIPFKRKFLLFGVSHQEANK